MHFYTVALPRCRCGKPATVEVQGTGNVRYDRCCDACGKRKVKELTRVYAPKEATHDPR